MKHQKKADTYVVEYYTSVKDLGTPELAYRLQQNGAELNSIEGQIKNLVDALHVARLKTKVLNEQRNVLAAILDDRR